MGLISRVSSRTYRNFLSFNYFFLKWPNEPRKSESSVNTEPDTVLLSESSSSEWKFPSTNDTPTHTPEVIPTLCRHLGMQKIRHQNLRRRLRSRNRHRQDCQIRFETTSRCSSHLNKFSKNNNFNINIIFMKKVCSIFE